MVSWPKPLPPQLKLLLLKLLPLKLLLLKLLPLKHKLLEFLLLLKHKLLKPPPGRLKSSLP